MSLLGHDDVIFFPGKMMSGFIFYLPVFSIVSKHIKWSFLTKQIILEIKYYKQDGFKHSR